MVIIHTQLNREARELVPWNQCIRRPTKMRKSRALELLVVLVSSLCWTSAMSAQGTLRVGAARSVKSSFPLKLSPPLSRIYG